MMIVKKRYVILIAVILVGFGVQHCVDPFNPPVTNYTDLLVIGGTLTDMPGKQTITVSRTTPYTDSTYIPEDGCSVMVIDDKGNIISYAGKGRGKYVAEFSSDELQYGRGYMLRVIGNNGDVYESDYQILRPAPPIDSVTASYQPEVTAENPEGLNGYQFYVNTGDQSGNTKYYRWSMRETWEYHSLHPADLMWDGTLHMNYSLPPNRRTCWETMDVPGIYVATTRDMSEDKLKNIKLNYVSTESDRLKWKYSLLVRQYALSAEAYDFWNGLQKQTQETGSLYQTQPYMIKGNITCVSNPGETVLGAFSVCGVSEKRIFVGPAPEKVQDINCSPDTLRRLMTDLEMMPESMFPVYMYYAYSASGAKSIVTSDQRCFDCLVRGGTNVKPDFWP